MNILRASQVAMVKNLPANAGDEKDAGSILEVGNGNLLQYSCLEYSMDRGAWLAKVHGLAKSGSLLVPCSLPGPPVVKCFLSSVAW